MTAPVPTIIDTLDHPDLFAPHFKGGAASWAAWRSFLSALFALPMDEGQLEIYRQFTGRKTAPSTPFTEAALICGRRAGKSRILALIAVYLAVFRDYTTYLSTGEVATIPIIAADRKQARTIFRYIMGLLNDVPYLAKLKHDETNDSVAVGKNVQIEIHTATFRGIRGYSLGALLIDEVAFLRTEETSANPDEEILAAARPGLSTIPGAMLLMGSSAYAKRGALYSAFKRHWGQDDSDVIVWKAGTRDMHPGFPQRTIDVAMENDAPRANAEFLSIFRDDIASYVSREVVEACVVPGRYELTPISGIRYHAFCDPSGGSSNSFTVAVAHSERGIVLLDAIREVRPPFSPSAVVEDFSRLLLSYDIRKVRGDRYAGEFPRELFRKAGIEYELAEQPCSDLLRDLLPKLNSRQVELLDHPRMVKQFADLERRTARSGKDSISHQQGGHDDICASVAGAILMAGSVRAPMRIAPETLAYFQKQLPTPGSPAWRLRHG